MFDVVIIGSGLGGLICANILAQQGMKVCVVEKNKQIGGNLQIFARNKQIFDTGVHYIGGLGKGQNLYQVFKYLRLIHKLNLKRMDEGFDRVLIEGDSKEYVLAQGYPAFIKNLVKDFPEDESAIIGYCKKIREACTKFPLYHLLLESDANEKLSAMSISAKDVIESLTSNKKLQAILAGNNLLYSGVADKTPFHVHALIINSYIESSWKLVDGGSQIAKILSENIHASGGEIIRNCEVKEIVENNGKITHINTEDGKSICASHFISNISPSATVNITHSRLLKEMYRKRITKLENTISSFSLYVVLKEGAVKYQNHNYYYHKQGYIWHLNDYNEANWPLGYGLYFTEDRNQPGYASAVTLLTPMRFEDVNPWANTYNRVGKADSRGEGYEAFKQKKAAKLLDVVQEKFPWLRECIAYTYAATPLTNRDYIGMPDGSMYGIQKDFNDPLKTMISPRTKIPNLFLTGQNLNLHGILGTSLSAVLTCTILLNDTTIVDKIRNA